MTFIFREFLRRENLKLAAEEQKARGGVPYERQEDRGVGVGHGEAGFRYLL